ncbi:Bacterial regulatory protein, Fis family [compost metagenome]
MCEGPLIQPGHLPDPLHSQGLPGSVLEDARELEPSPQRQALIDALIRHRWKPTATAKALGISRATLYRRVHQHGIEMPGRSPA